MTDEQEIRCIFQKRDGRWLMIHQHVSFPYDAESGLAQTELSP